MRTPNPVAGGSGSPMTGHLLHVGFPKTGSNFLRRWFREHPQLAYAEGGIAGYGNVYEIAREAVSERADVRYRVTSCESLTAPQQDTGSPGSRLQDPIDVSIGQETACAALANLFPEAHVVIVTRGFRSMICSSFSQFVRTGAGMTMEESLRHPLVMRAWDYDRVIGLYQRAFGPDRVTVLPYELLCDDADRFVATLEGRLGLSHFAPAPDRLNAALSPVELYWYPRLTRIVRGLPIGAPLKRAYLRSVFRNRLRPAIAILQRLRPGAPVTEEAVPEPLIEAYRMKALSLRDNALFTPYAREYYEA